MCFLSVINDALLTVSISLLTTIRFIVNSAYWCQVFTICLKTRGAQEWAESNHTVETKSLPCSSLSIPERSAAFASQLL